MKHKFTFPLCALGLVLAGLASTSSLQAAPVSLQNPGFEAPALADGASDATITGWVKSASGNNSLTYNPLLIDTPPQSGMQTYLATSSGSTIGQFIFQSDLLQVQSNTTYTLSLYVAGRTTLTTAPGYGGYLAQIGVGDFGIDTETAGANFRTLAVSNGAGTGAQNKPFELITFSFTTPADLTNTTVRAGSVFDNTAPTSQADITGQYLRIGVGMPLTVAGGFVNGTQTLIDSVAFDATAVPEPSTWALLGVSMIGGLVMFRRRA